MIKHKITDKEKEMLNGGIAVEETKEHGAELITIHFDSTWDLEQIPLESIVK